MRGILINVNALGECTIRNQADCVVDVSKYENNGILGSSIAGTDPTWNSSSKYGGGFEFDGVDDYITIDDAPELSFGNGSSDSPFSLSAWINQDNDTENTIMYKGIATFGAGGYLEWWFEVWWGDVGLLIYDETDRMFECYDEYLRLQPNAKDANEIKEYVERKKKRRPSDNVKKWIDL